MHIRHDELRTLEYLAQKYDTTNIPLYLSYPTQGYWNEDIDEEIYIEDYKDVERPFLYFHFPYCPKPCYYCVCYKDITANDHDKDVYIGYLKREFNRKLSLLGVANGLRTDQLHWGGGTPTYMNCRQIEEIFGAISEKVTILATPHTSVSIEAYPDEAYVTGEKLRLLRDLGFGVISFGIQDFDEQIQGLINRNCRVDMTRRLVEQSKAYGFKVHVDLCYGLPFQGINELRRTITEVLKMEPDRAALFSYAHYPFSFPLQKMIPTASIPNSFVKVLLAKRAGELFLAHGYEAVGSNHFVKPGDALYRYAQEGRIIKNFMGYSNERRKNCIGFGKAAISASENGLYHNALSLKDYYSAIAENRLPIRERANHIFSRDDKIRDAIIRRDILCRFAIDKSSAAEQFGIDFDSYFKHENESLLDYERDGLIETCGAAFIKVTDTGKLFVNHLAHVFDVYYRR